MQDPAAFYDLGLELLRHVECEDGNSLISPVSLSRPLAVLATGAAGATRTQIEGVLGASDDGTLADELKSLADGWRASGDTFSLSDSLWINEIFEPAPRFISEAKERFAAEMLTRTFGRRTLREINDWVRTHTHGMIDSILERIDPQNALYVINACAFEGKWTHPYSTYDVKRAEFHAADGSVESVDMMYERKVSGYLENDLCVGFAKRYEGERYAFAGLLPKGDMLLDRLLESLDGDVLAELMCMRSRDKVSTALPKFSGTFVMDLSPTLQSLGMSDAFDPRRADFSGIRTNAKGDPLCIDEIVQKTFIEVNEAGTRASAVTRVDVLKAGGPFGRIEYHTVVLDRPFLYVIFDVLENAPLFMGTVGSVRQAREGDE